MILTSNISSDVTVNFQRKKIDKIYQKKLST